jgi:anti-sigma factor RsiW
MCVRDENLSAYIDDELNAEETRAVQEHLHTCGQCRARADALRRTKMKMQDADTGSGLPIAAAQERVRTAVERRISGKRRSLRRGVYLPLPAAVAAAALFFMLVGALIGVSVGSSRGQPSVAGQAESGESDAAIAAEAAAADRESLEELIRFLSSQGASLEVHIQLPSSSRFTVQGEPRLIRAAEFEGY